MAGQRRLVKSCPSITSGIRIWTAALGYLGYLTIRLRSLWLRHTWTSSFRRGEAFRFCSLSLLHLCLERRLGETWDFLSSPVVQGNDCESTFASRDDSRDQHSKAVFLLTASCTMRLLAYLK
jgi:hypothetical protein